MSEVNSSNEKTGNKVGVAALIVGIAALAFCANPSTFFLALLFGFAGIVLGIIGLNIQNDQRGQAIWGLVLATLALIIYSGILIPSVSISAQTEPDSVSTTGSASPTSSQESATARATITCAGTGDGNSAKQPLSGDYQVTLDALGDCFYGGDLEGSGSEDLPTIMKSGTVTSSLYGISAGDYYVDMITGPSPGCGWTLTLTPVD
jgi:hypothetical protein